MQNATWIRRILSIKGLTHRIHGAGIFTYIGIILNYLLGVNVGKYSSTMDPLGKDPDFTDLWLKSACESRRARGFLCGAGTLKVGLFGYDCWFSAHVFISIRKPKLV